MPNYVKYSTSIPSGSLLKGTVALGVTTASIAGPTSTTNWYAGITPTSGKYVIYKTAATGDPDIFCPQTNQELFNFVIMQGGSSSDITSVSASLAWIGTQSNLMAANFDYENIVTDGLVLNIDAGFVGSYPTTASTWYDISGNNNSGSLINGPTFSSANSGSIVFDGVDDYGVISNSNSINLTGSFTIFSWIYPYSISGWIAVLYKNSQSNNGGYHIGIDPSGYLQGGIRYNSGWVTIQSSINQLQINTWQQICMSINFTTQVLTLYKNGVSIKEQTNFNYTLAGNTTPLYVGSNASVPSELFSGRISLSQLYNRTLSAAEITQNYNAQKGRFGL
jgi:hypothetical protein